MELGDEGGSHDASQMPCPFREMGPSCGYEVSWQPVPTPEPLAAAQSKRTGACREGHRGLWTWSGLALLCPR